MDSTDADDENICNSSLGREVMQTVTSRRSHRRVSFLNFCTPNELLHFFP